MKAFFTIFAWFATLGNMMTVRLEASGVRGCVIFKRPSEAVPSIVEYQSYQTFSTNIQVKDGSGEMVRILPRENPIFIPYPSDPGASAASAKPKIDRAMMVYPGAMRQLLAIRQSWDASARQRPPIARSRKTTPRKAAPKPTVTPSQTTPGNEITTLNGKRYRNFGIQRVEPDGLWLLTNAGSEKVLFENLPVEMQKTYHYDKEAAVEYTKRARELERQKALATELALADAAKKQAAAEKIAAIRNKLGPAIKLHAVHIYGRVLSKNENGVLIESENFDSADKKLPGVPHRTAPVFIKGCPRASEWSEGDRVNEIATPDVGQASYINADGVRLSVQIYLWMPNPLNDAK